MKNNSHYTLSISDLLMGFLFVFILILLKFMIEYNNKKNNLSKPFINRAKLMGYLKEEIEKENIEVKIDIENGILELPKTLCFDEGKYELNNEKKQKLKKVREIMIRKIVCYSNWNSEKMEKRLKNDLTYRKWKHDCEKSENQDKEKSIDTILIEGHADSTLIGENLCKNKEDMLDFDKSYKCIRTNIELSMERAKNVFKFLLQYDELKTEKGNQLYALVNENDKPLFGVTSYGSLRSSDQKPDSSPSEKECINREIHIRFITSQPDKLEENLDELKNI